MATNAYALDDKGQKGVWSGAVTDVHTTQKEVIGSTRFHGMKVYRYHKFDNGSGNVAAVVGNAVYFKQAQDIVTSDITDADASPHMVVAGVLVSAPADGQFCWIQVRGPVTLNQAVGSYAAGKGAKGHASTDGLLTICEAADVMPATAVCSGVSNKDVWLTCIM